MVNNRENDQKHCAIDSEFVKIMMVEMKKLFQHELDKHPRSLTDGILDLRKEVQVLEDCNIDLINLLANKNTQRNEISTELSNDLDTSFLSCSSADTIVEATQWKQQVLMKRHSQR
ncbi:hypothetical protein JTB14_036564 [Gonioctena quinquepunctata]|nr:hypothetical protein JTB14_036564 [Gonioctena quinquepunctata]